VCEVARGRRIQLDLTEMHQRVVRADEHVFHRASLTGGVEIFNRDRVRQREPSRRRPQEESQMCSAACRATEIIDQASDIRP
jgi:hypothetical protein